MKVGFAVQVNQGLESAVYDHFGSAPAFLIVDTELKQISTVGNSDADRVHGTCNPVATLGGNRVDALVVGGIGAHAIMKLNALGVRVYSSAASTVSENIELLKENRLQELTMEDSCKSHQGQCGH